MCPWGKCPGGTCPGGGGGGSVLTPLFLYLYGKQLKIKWPLCEIYNIIITFKITAIM